MLHNSNEERLPSFNSSSLTSSGFGCTNIIVFKSGSQMPVQLHHDLQHRRRSMHQSINSSTSSHISSNVEVSVVESPLVFGHHTNQQFADNERLIERHCVNNNQPLIYMATSGPIAALSSLQIPSSSSTRAKSTPRPERTGSAPLLRALEPPQSSQFSDHVKAEQPMKPLLNSTVGLELDTSFGPMNINAFTMKHVLPISPVSHKPNSSSADTKPTISPPEHHPKVEEVDQKSHPYCTSLTPDTAPGRNNATPPFLANSWGSQSSRRRGSFSGLLQPPLKKRIIAESDIETSITRDGVMPGYECYKYPLLGTFGTHGPRGDPEQRIREEHLASSISRHAQFLRNNDGPSSRANDQSYHLARNNSSDDGSDRKNNIQSISGPHIPSRTLTGSMDGGPNNMHFPASGLLQMHLNGLSPHHLPLNGTMEPKDLPAGLARSLLPVSSALVANGSSRGGGSAFHSTQTSLGSRSGDQNNSAMTGTGSNGQPIMVAISQQYQLIQEIRALPQGECFQLALAGWEWFSVDSVRLPCVFRQGEKYLAVHMVQMRLLAKFPPQVPGELMRKHRMLSHKMSVLEAWIFNTVNALQCRHEYGYQLFSPNDEVVKAADVDKFYWAVKAFNLTRMIDIYRNEIRANADLHLVLTAHISSLKGQAEQELRQALGIERVPITVEPTTTSHTPTPTPTSSHNNNNHGLSQRSINVQQHSHAAAAMAAQAAAHNSLVPYPHRYQALDSLSANGQFQTSLHRMPQVLPLQQHGASNQLRMPYPMMNQHYNHPLPRRL